MISHGVMLVDYLRPNLSRNSMNVNNVVNLFEFYVVVALVQFVSTAMKPGANRPTEQG